MGSTIKFDFFELYAYDGQKFLEMVSISKKQDRIGIIRVRRE